MERQYRPGNAFSCVAYLSNLVLGHRIRHIALVLEDKETGPGKTLWNNFSGHTHVVGTTYLLKQQAGQLPSAVLDPLAVCCINDPDQRVRLLEVVFPVCPQRFLPADIP